MEKKKDPFKMTTDEYMQKFKEQSNQQGYRLDDKSCTLIKDGLEMKKGFDSSMGELTGTIELAVRKQENFYVEGFTQFLRRKEVELRDVLIKLEERYRQSDSKDIIISQLRSIVLKLEQDFLKFMEKERKMKENTRRLLEMLSDIQHDRQMLKDKARQKIRQTKTAERQLFEERMKKEAAFEEIKHKNVEISDLKEKVMRLEALVKPGMNSVRSVSELRAENIMSTKEADPHSYQCPYTEN